jgi:hypothetical protein
MKKNTLISIILCFSLIFYGSFFVDLHPLNAYTVTDLSDLLPDWGGFGSALASLAGDIGRWVATQSKEILNGLGTSAVIAAKILALLAVQKATAFLIGDGDGLLIRDYNNYLYVSPQQRAMTQMTTFFNTVSRGRLSSLNYEGIGPNYDAYLVSQAMRTITGPTFVTTLQEQAPNPNQLFDSGNMKALTTYMQCANNVPCFSLVSGARYTKELTKAQDIARSEQQNGFLPTKAASGRITKPAALAQNALLQVDQVGTQLIMNAKADTKEQVPSALSQIATGATISITSRAINYGISDDAGKAAIVAQNNQFPFSIGYSSLGGASLTSGKTTINTGTAATSTSTVMGNTQVTGGINVNAAGAQVTSSTQRVE